MKRLLLSCIAAILLFGFLLPAKVIKNPDKPVKGVWDLKPQKVWTLSETGTETLSRPEIAVAPDGTCFIHDFKNKLSYIFTPEGKFVKSLAPKGEGPGEVKLHILSFAVKDKFLAADLDRIHYFSHEGAFLKAIPNLFGQREPHSFIDEKTFISAPPHLLGAQGEISLVTLQGESKVLKEYPVPADCRPKKQDGPPITVIGLSPMLVSGYDHRNKILYYGINSYYSIDAIDLAGKQFCSFSVDRQKKNVSREAIKKELEVFVPGGPQDQIVNNLPDKLTFFHRIQVIDGLVYVFSSNFGFEWKDQPIDIFSRDGKYLYRAVFTPEKDWSIFYSTINFLQVADGYLYIVLEDEAGEIVINKYRISLPEV